MRQLYISTEEVKIKPSDNSGIVIEGVALPIGEVSRNGILYTQESVTKAYKTMEGKPLLFNHDVNKVIGHIEEVWLDGNKMMYKANVDPAEPISRKLKRGDIKNVSITAIVDNTQMKEDYIQADVKEFLELSVVTIPGFADTTIELKNEMLKKMKEEDSRYQNPDGTFKKMTCPDDPDGEPSKFCGCVRYMMNKKGLSLDSAKKLCAYIKKKKGSSYDPQFDNVIEFLQEVDKMKSMKEQDEPANPPAENPPEEQPKDPMEVINDRLTEIEQKIQELDARVTKLENPPEEQPKEEPTEKPNENPQESKRETLVLPTKEEEEVVLDLDSFKKIIVG